MKPHQLGAGHFVGLIKGLMKERNAYLKCLLPVKYNDFYGDESSLHLLRYLRKHPTQKFTQFLASLQAVDVVVATKHVSDFILEERGKGLGRGDKTTGFFPTPSFCQGLFKISYFRR